MAGAARTLAVQVSAVHHRMPDPGNAWQMGVLAVGVALVAVGALRFWRARRWQWGRLAGLGTAGQRERVPLPWTLIAGIAVVGVFLAVVAAT